MILGVVQELGLMTLVSPLQLWGGDYPEKTGIGLWWAWKQMKVVKVVQRAGSVSPVVPELALPPSVPWPGKIPILVPSRCQREQRLRVKPVNWQGLGNYRCA